MDDTLNEINLILLEQARRLNKININDKSFDNEIERAKAIALTACQFVNSRSLELKRDMLNNHRAKNLEYYGE